MSDSAFVFLYHAVSWFFIPWPTVCEWQCIWFYLQCSLIALHHITNRQWVTVHSLFFTMQSHCIASYDQQGVSDSSFVYVCHAVYHVVPHPMTKSTIMWVTLHLFFFTMQSHCISSHGQQQVSDSVLVLLCHAISLHSIPWPIGCEWQCISFSLPCNLIGFHPMTNRLWVIPHFICYHMVWLEFIPWPTGCGWQWIFSLPCNLIGSICDQQQVSDSAFIFFTTWSHCILSTESQQYHSFPNAQWSMINRK